MEGRRLRGEVIKQRSFVFLPPHRRCLFNQKSVITSAAVSGTERICLHLPESKRPQIVCKRPFFFYAAPTRLGCKLVSSGPILASPRSTAAARHSSFDKLTPPGVTGGGGNRAAGSGGPPDQDQGDGRASDESICSASWCSPDHKRQKTRRQKSGLTLDRAPPPGEPG